MEIELTEELKKEFKKLIHEVLDERELFIKMEPFLAVPLDIYLKDWVIKVFQGSDRF